MTDLLAFMVIVVVVDELVILPDQPEKAWPESGVAVSVMTDPLRYGLKASVEIEPLPQMLVVKV